MATASQSLYATIINAGTEAYGCGKTAEENPWPAASSERASWLAGWLSAKSIAQPELVRTRSMARVIPPHPVKGGLWTPEQRAKLVLDSGILVGGPESDITPPANLSPAIPDPVLFEPSNAGSERGVDLSGPNS